MIRALEKKLSAKIFISHDTYVRFSFFFENLPSLKSSKTWYIYVAKGPDYHNLISFFAGNLFMLSKIEIKNKLTIFVKKVIFQFRISLEIRGRFYNRVYF